mgnify:CR=1 FL=1
MPAGMKAFNLSNLMDLKTDFSKKFNNQTSAKRSSDFISSLQQKQQSKQLEKTNYSQSQAKDSKHQIRQGSQEDTTSQQIDSAHAKQDLAKDKSVQNRNNAKINEEARVSEEQSKASGTKISQDELKKVRDLLAKELDELSDKDLEALLANLTKILEKISQQLEGSMTTNQEQLQKLAEAIFSKGEKLQKLMANLNTKTSNKFKELLKQLNSTQEEFLAKQAQQNAKGEAKLKSRFQDTVKKLKRLLQETNAKVINSSKNSKSSQNLANQKILSQFNLAQSNETNKGRNKAVSSNFDLKKLGQKISDKLSKQQGFRVGNLSADKQVTDLKTITQKNKANFNLNNLSNLNLGQFNTESRVFSQSTTTKSMAAKTMNLQNILDQMNNKMNFNALRQGNKVTMQLEPEFLGKIQMEVGVDNGSVTAKILADSNGVKELLNANLIKLKSALEEKGIEIDQFDVSVGYQEEDSAQENSSQQEFLFKQQQEKNKLNKFSLENDRQDLTEEVETRSEEDNSISADAVNYMA